MDAYLRIAEDVLKTVRRPLGPRAMLVQAYRQGIVPKHLHGRTQFKTLGARISEDILKKRDGSLFFRTQPGRFFLREFLTEETLPEEYRQPIIARRRVRELVRGPALAIRLAHLSNLAASNVINRDRLLKFINKTYDCYDDYRYLREDSVFIWSFVLVKRENLVLSYRLGRYRDDRDSFMTHRSIGFKTLVVEHERTLFNLTDMGIVDAGVKATTIDLDIPVIQSKNADTKPAKICHFLVSQTTNETKDILAVVEYECPGWFEPMRRRLAINDLDWLDLHQPVNNIDDFDPWSKLVLLTYMHRTLTVAPISPPAALRGQRRISEGAARDAQS